MIPLYNPRRIRYNSDMEARKKKHLIVLACVAAGLTGLLFFLLWIRTLSPAFSEFVCRFVSRPWIYVVGHINSIFPFSVFEICVVTLIVVAVHLLMLMIVALTQKRGAAVLKGVAITVICILSAFNLYTLLVGFSYYRPAAPVPQSEKEYTADQVTAMVRDFADDYNRLAQSFDRDEAGNVISPYSPRELSNKLQNEFRRLGGNYYYAYTPPATQIYNSWFLTLNNISGITFVPLGEPTVNRNIPSSDLAQTMAHEMAHTKGVMREGEANFVSYYLLLSSSDDYLSYCGYFAVFHALLPAVNAGTSNKADYLEIRRNMSPLIGKELANASAFWTEKSKQPGLAGLLNRVFEKVGDFMNDVFLKSNGAQNGNGSYSDKVTDGSITDTGETHPDTGEIIYAVTYSSVQKMFFAVYEERAHTATT